MTQQEDLDLLAGIAARVTNVGRWGEDDERGTANLIGVEARLRGVAAVVSGECFSLALDRGDGRLQTGYLRRFDPMTFVTRSGTDVTARGQAGLPPGIGGADDIVIMPTAAGTHWDSLAHMFYDNKMWNGYDARLVGSDGAARNDVTGYRDQLVGRAVLLDLPRFFELSWCEPGRGVSPADLDGCLAVQRCLLVPGDMLLLRFGEISRRRETGEWGDYAGGPCAGLDLDTLMWLRDHDVAAVASDTWGVEVRPNVTASIEQPWHRVALPSMGLAVGEMFDLDALAEACARDLRYEVLLVANPLPLRGAINGPVNPTAIR